MSKTDAMFHTPDSATPIEADGYWHPFMNEVARANLGYGNDFGQCYALIKDYRVAIDGGAQVGRVANRLASMFEKVYAIELARENFACLVKNKLPNVTARHACLTNRMGGTYTAVPDKHPDSPVYRAEAGGKIEGLTIDYLLSTCSPPESCGFIKLDLQGYDLFALYGAEQTLRQYKPVLYFEYDPSCFEMYGIHEDSHAKYLTRLGYTFYGTDDGNQLWA